MSTPEQDRLDHLDKMEQEMKRDPLGYMGLEKPMPWPEFVRLLGGPEGIAKTNREIFWREFRQKVFFIAACALPIIFIGLIVAAVVFGWR